MVDWATVGASVLLSVVGSIVVTEYQLQRESSIEESEEIENWYNKSASLAGQVQRSWARMFEDAEMAEMNLSELQSEMSLLEDQISRHATEGERLDANSDVISALDNLAEECRSVSELPLHMDSSSDFSDRSEDINEAAEGVIDEVSDR